MEASLSAAPGPAHLDHLEEFNLRLEDIIRTFGPAHSDSQGKPEAGSDIAAAMETEVAAIAASLSHCSCTQDKLEQLLRRHAHLVTESRVSAAARHQLETLCREQQQHYRHLQEDTLQQCREDEERRVEMSSHFQSKLTEIQEQIQQHSARNDKLCQENLHLTAKLEAIVVQCEQREEGLEKMNKRRDLQQQLMEAKLQQADAHLADAQEKHNREKEYLLREAIDKTKKCFAMKEQELAMKKKLTLYGQKFDEFQTTLAKSNEIYSRFKKEMNNMSDKMKKMEKESGVWKTRFENCNKALTDMIQERAEKSQEYDLFVLKIQRLEKLCRTLQEERGALYSKIKEVHQSNSSHGPPAQTEEQVEVEVEGLTAEEVQEIQGGDPVLTEDMSRLREEQAKLQEFAAALLATPSDGEEEEQEEEKGEEDAVASAFSHFTVKVKQEEPAEPQQVLEEPQEVKGHSQEVLEEPQEVKGHSQEPPAEPAESQQVLEEPQEVKGHSQEVLEEPQEVKGHSQEVLEEPKEVKGHSQEVLEEPQEVKGHSQEVLEEPQEVKGHSQEPPAEPAAAPGVKAHSQEPPAGPAAAPEVKGQSQEPPTAPTVEAEPVAEAAAAAAAAEEAPTKPQPQADQAPPASSQATPTSGSDPNRKQTPKKKKKRSAKSAS